MAHGLTEHDSMFSVRQMPWHGLGTVLDEYPDSIDEALERSGLGWAVEQKPVMFEAEPQWTDDWENIVPAKIVPAPGFKANVRDDTGKVLGIVSDDYRVVPNKDAFRFLDSLIGSDLHFETAGSLHGGRRVWVLVRIPEFIEMGGDECAQFIYCANSHDGSMAVTAAASNVRIVCANTLGMALRGSSAARSFKFRHTGDLQLKFDEARSVLGMTLNYGEQFKVLADELATRKLVSPQAERIVSKLVPIDEEMGKRARINRQNRRLRILDIYNGTTNTQGNSPGSAWCMVNAISEYADWDRRVTTATDQVARSFEDQALKSEGLQIVREEVAA